MGSVPRFSRHRWFGYQRWRSPSRGCPCRTRSTSSGASRAAVVRSYSTRSRRDRPRIDPGRAARDARSCGTAPAGRAAPAGHARRSESMRRTIGATSAVAVFAGNVAVTSATHHGQFRRSYRILRGIPRSPTRFCGPPPACLRRLVSCCSVYLALQRGPEFLMSATGWSALRRVTGSSCRPSCGRRSICSCHRFQQCALAAAGLPNFDPFWRRGDAMTFRRLESEVVPGEPGALLRCRSRSIGLNSRSAASGYVSTLILPQRLRNCGTRWYLAMCWTRCLAGMRGERELMSGRQRTGYTAPQSPVDCSMRLVASPPVSARQVMTGSGTSRTN